MYTLITKFGVVAVDDCDAELLNTEYSSVLLSTSGRLVGVQLYSKEKGKRYLHREIICAEPGQLVDHIDGDVLNNTRENLRIVTASQSQCNRGVTKDKKSGLPKGVFYCIRKQKYKAQIGYLGHKMHLGWFNSAEEASDMYNLFAKKLFGAYERKEK